MRHFSNMYNNINVLSIRKHHTELCIYLNKRKNEREEKKEGEKEGKRKKGMKRERKD